jgi:hypothetical protein
LPLVNRETAQGMLECALSRGTLLCGPAILFDIPSTKIQLPKLISFGEGLSI